MTRVMPLSHNVDLQTTWQTKNYVLQECCPLRPVHRVMEDLEGIGDKKFNKDTVWNWIKSREHSFFTIKMGHEADVFAAERNGYRYLTTEPDGIKDNNLDELPKCQ